MVLSVSESSEEAFEFGRLTVNEILLEPLSVESRATGPSCTTRPLGRTAVYGVCSPPQSMMTNAPAKIRT